MNNEEAVNQLTRIAEAMEENNKIMRRAFFAGEEQKHPQPLEMIAIEMKELVGEIVELRNEVGDR